jgi:hyperosmotically inducible protein
MRINKKIIVILMIAFQSVTIWAFDFFNLNAKYVVENDQKGTATKEIQSGTSTDNSKVTPQNQSNKPSDIEITKKIRKEIMATKGMSIDAQNVKIITMNGKVTLRGTVDSEKEKSTINQFATKIVGPENVVNELQLKK